MNGPLTQPLPDASGRPLSRLAVPVLAVTVLVQALGLVATTLQVGTSVGTWLFTHHGWSEAAFLAFERACTLLAVLGSVLAVFVRRPTLRLVAAGVASAWVAALALAEWRVGGAPFTDFALPAYATRIAAPLLLVLWERRGTTLQVLRVSIALTFAVHGMESIRLHPGFIDYLLIADHRLFGLGLRQRGAELLLVLIGVHDVLVAALVLAGRASRRTLAWAAFWGVVTALSRIVQGGEAQAHAALVRAANGGLPLVLLLLSQRTSMNTTSLRMGGRLARVALPLLLLVLPLAAGAQALSGAAPGHLRLVWTEDPAHRTTFSWSTSAEGSTHEVYLDTQPRGGVPSAYARKAAATKNLPSGGAFAHHAVVSDLQPSTTYYFVVVSDGQASPERHFVTAPVDDRPFRLLSGGDSRSGLEDRKKMNQLMAKLTEEDPGILAFVHGGDYNQSSTDWAEWSGWLADHALTFTSDGRVLPIIPTRGNHEGDPAVFDAVFNTPGAASGSNYYAVKLGANVSLIILDTNGSIGGTQAEWLEQQLQQAQAGRWIVPGYHRPAFPAVKDASGARQFWVPLFEKYDADLALESDGHVLKRTLPIRNEQYDATGVVYVGEGGLGVPQRTPTDQWYLKAPGMAKSVHHVQVLSFSPEKLVYEARGMTGTVEDHYEIQPKRSGLSVAPAATGPALTSVASKSDTQVTVTFSVDLEAASAGATSAYQLSPDAQVRAVALSDPRTAVLTTSTLKAGAQYQLTVTGVRSADGTAMAQPATATFQAASGVTVPVPQPAPSSPAVQAPAALEGPSRTGCAAAAGGTLVWAGVAVAALASRRRRSQQGGR